MAVTLGLNSALLGAQRQLAKATDANSKAFARLSSGQRIVSASDDAAGLALSKDLQLQSRLNGQAVRNLSDGLSALNIAQSALTELVNIQTRIIELAEQSANGVNSNRQRKALQLESDQLTAEMNRIVAATKFNDRQLFSPTANIWDIQGGTNSDSNISLSIGNALIHNVATGTFATASEVVHSTGTNAWDTSLADLNNDGNLDAIFYTNMQMVYSFGNGDGTFGAQVTISPVYSSGTGEAVFIDINADKKLDMIVSESDGVSGHGTLNVRLGNGNGTFTAGRSYSNYGSWGREEINYADLNGDGIADISYADALVAGGPFMVHYGTGQGTFSNAVSYSGRGGAFNASTSSIGDFNGDGASDVVISSNVNDNLFGILLGTGNGTFSSSITTSPSGAGTARWIEVGDFNRDGIDDLFLTRWSTQAGIVLIGNGDGTFSVRQTLDAGQISEVIDFNKDGFLDIIATGGPINVYLGNGDGSFKLAGAVSTTNIASHGVAVGDMNNDGAYDILEAIYTSGYVERTLSSPVATLNFAYSNVYNRDVARISLDEGREVLKSITQAQGELGAYESRIDAAISVARSMQLNTEDAYSRISDIDVAEEVSKLVAAQLIQKSSAALVSHIGSDSDIVLKLLQIE